ncbi:MAG: phage tail sheath family protein, partial [Schwartzia sp.]|nr:phage tail sheath family protein [Schwartzia sp. (in: firmicutes)]
MAYKHGVYTQEVPTSLVPMTQTDAGLIIAVGTAPLHLASDPIAANKPLLAYSYNEAVAALGYSEDWEKYTLSEAIYTQFALFNMAPIVLINVLDPKNDNLTKKINDAETTMEEGKATIAAPAAMLETLKVKATAGGNALTSADYTAAYDDDENLIITATAGGAIASATKIFVSYTALDASKIDKYDIIGGVNSTTGQNEGLELIEDIYPRFGLVPGTIVAPGWSHDPEVAAVMKAKETNIDGHFKAISICDADDTVAKKYTDVSEWKNRNNYVDIAQVLCWPRLSLGDKKYHMSMQLASLMNKTDAAHDDVPYKSPSNENLQADGAVTADGQEIYLSTQSAAYLNGQGIVTALNFIGGWKAWGNRTTAYPSNTDPKDAFIPIRRMFNWVGNTLVTSFWQKVDDPMNKRLIAS